MNLFYTSDIRGEYAWFSAEEARHIAQVLRKQPGDEVNFTDGFGGLYKSVIDEIGKHHLVARIVDKTVGDSIRHFRLHLAVAPTKNIDRFEWLLEKATEIGVDEISPVICSNSERNRIKEDRLEKVLLSAMKQSLKTQLPVLNKLSSFSAFLEQHATTAGTMRFIAHCRSETLAYLNSCYEHGNDVCILIGPEGDFTQEEVNLAEQKGWKSISLGSSRLRTETAGIVACHIINLING